MVEKCLSRVLICGMAIQKVVVAIILITIEVLCVRPLTKTKYVMVEEKPGFTISGVLCEIDAEIIIVKLIHDMEGVEFLFAMNG